VQLPSPVSSSIEAQEVEDQQLNSPKALIFSDGEETFEELPPKATTAAQSSSPKQAKKKLQLMGLPPSEAPKFHLGISLDSPPKNLALQNSPLTIFMDTKEVNSNSVLLNVKFKS
jgi:hypothetical protein